MATLNAKDASRMETQRYLVETDPPFYAVLNRGFEDLDQRTSDLSRIVGAARGFHVHETTPPSLTVEVEDGWYLDDELNPSPFPSSGAVATTLTVPVATPGNIRIDLVYFDTESGTIGRAVGTEVLESSGFSNVFEDATPLRGTLPANNGAVPLAYLYVDSDPTLTFQDTTAVNVAGHIRDARLAPGGGLRVLETAAANLKSDTAGGSAGSSAKVVASDHQHPLNRAVTVPATPATSGPSVGTSSYYAMRDHVHALPMETAASNLKSDAASGSAGSASTKLVRSDHRHPPNVGTSAPGTVQSGVAGAAGSSTVYARQDHVHALTFGAGLNGKTKTLEWAFDFYSLFWNNDNSSKNTGALSRPPVFAIFYFAGSIPGIVQTGFYGMGFALPGGAGKSISAINYTNNDFSQASSGRDTAPLGYPTTGSGYQSSYTFEATLSEFSQTGGITLSPNSNVTASVSILVGGFMEV